MKTLALIAMIFFVSCTSKEDVEYCKKYNSHIDSMVINAYETYKSASDLYVSEAKIRIYRIDYWKPDCGYNYNEMSFNENITNLIGSVNQRQSQGHPVAGAVIGGLLTGTASGAIVGSAIGSTAR